FEPKLCKRRFLTVNGYAVYSVNALAVRNFAQPDEEFGNFATQREFPNLIPKDEFGFRKKSPRRRGFSLSPIPSRGSSERQRAKERIARMTRALWPSSRFAKWSRASRVGTVSRIRPRPKPSIKPTTQRLRTATARSMSGLWTAIWLAAITRPTI